MPLSDIVKVVFDVIGVGGAGGQVIMDLLDLRSLARIAGRCAHVAFRSLASQNYRLR